MAKKLYVRNAANDAWVEIATSIPNIENYLTQSSASLIYATKEELANIDISSASAAAVAYLTDSAPEALNTLNELAAALNDDNNFAGTVTTALAGKLDISSASTTYATKTEVENIDLSGYLTNANASSTYVAINNMSATPVSLMISGTTEQRPSYPVDGMFRFNTTTYEPEWYTSLTSSWVNFRSNPYIYVDYLVLAGGGGGGQNAAGGGGAGGYRCTVDGSGSGADSESKMVAVPNISYTVTVGAGGVSSGGTGGNGSNSVFASITSIGGGGGGSGQTGTSGQPGGCGGGGAYFTGSLGGDGTPGQGFGGGGGGFSGNGSGSGGGGGASAFGGNVTNQNGAKGGNGKASSITGSSVVRAGGGGGGAGQYGTGGAGGNGGGGTGSNGSATTYTSGAANYGAGGGGASYAGSGNGGNGGSGVVILRYLSSYNITVSGGLNATTTTSGAYKVTTINSGTGTVSFS